MPPAARQHVNPTAQDAGAVEGHTCWQTFTVPFSFPVIFTRELFHPDNNSLFRALSHREPDKRHRLIVFADSGVLQACPSLSDDVAAYCASRADALELVCPVQKINGGESIKADWASIEWMHRILQEANIDRHSYVLAIGGGAVLDAVGLVAATAHRGIRHVRIPTTVLSQNDSGVGVKNGINQFAQKNWLGTFAPPWAVLNDSVFLEYLNDREKRAGMAEAVKVALIRDAEFFEWLCEHSDSLAEFEPNALAYLVRRCAELHMQQIGQGGDPFELGSARPLDFGHWAAHRMESMSEHQLRHGEAVAIGIALDTRYSVLSGMLEAKHEERIYGLLIKLGFTLWHETLEQKNQQGKRSVISGLADFQAHLGGELTITLLESIGVGREVHQMHLPLINEAIDYLKSRA